MPRRKNRVKRFLSSPGLVDLHFHGAFGVDLMMLPPDHQLDELALQLGKNGVAGFCPTTLSAPLHELIPVVHRLGQWIHQKSKQKPLPQAALPLGIHLEGPFIHPESRGAHPVETLSPFRWENLQSLWEASLQTLKILTIAPEQLSPQETKKLALWCKKNKIHLSAGHTRVTEKQARTAFDFGFRGVTHAWNAMPFHHRDPGLLGAALGRPDIWVEVIADGVHVHPTVFRWTTKLHTHGICWISDCAPAAATPPHTWHTFGSKLKVQIQNSACQTQNGTLAGGGLLVTRAYQNWLQQEAQQTGVPLEKILKKSLPWTIQHPLKALYEPISPRKLPIQLEWDLKNGEFHLKRFDYRGRKA